MMKWGTLSVRCESRRDSLDTHKGEFRSLLFSNRGLLYVYKKAEMKDFILLRKHAYAMC